MSESICIIKPDDFHAHLRQDVMLAKLIPVFSKYFGKVLVMPNIFPPVTNAASLSSYKKQIENYSPSFIPLMTFLIKPNMSLLELQNLQHASAIAAKLYPSKVTFAKEGVTNVEDLFHSLEILESLDIVLCVHGEAPQEDPMEAEKIFLQHWLTKIIKKFPKLRIVLEHISSKESVNFVKEYNDPQKLVATITPHHLSITIEDLLGSNFHPFLFCKPIVKKLLDKEALQEAIFCSSGGFFLGTDSAPHTIESKLSESCPPGIFCAPVAIPLITQIFSKISRFQFAEKLEQFCSINGATFYKLPINKEKIILQKVPWTVQSELPNVKTFLDGTSLSWQLFSKNLPE